MGIATKILWIYSAYVGYMKYGWISILLLLMIPLTWGLYFVHVLKSIGYTKEDMRRAYLEEDVETIRHIQSVCEPLTPYVTFSYIIAFTLILI